MLCGDSTVADDVSKVLCGNRANYVFTSPPYGNQRDYTTGGIGDWDVLMRGVFAHLPLLFAVQYALMDWALAWPLKFLIACALTLNTGYLQLRR